MWKFFKHRAVAWFGRQWELIDWVLVALVGLLSGLLIALLIWQFMPWRLS